MSEQPPDHTAADWLMDLFVYAPIGFILEADKYVPQFAERGRNQLALARFIGKFAVDRLEKQLGPLGSFLQAAGPCGGGAPSTPTSSADSPADAGGAEAAAPDSAGTTAGETEAAGGSERASEPAEGNTTEGRAAGDTTGGAASASRPPRKRAGTATTRKAPGPPAGGPTTRQRGGSRSRPAATPATPATPVTRGPAVDAAVPDEAELALTGYATLSASQIVPRLTTLDAADLAAIGRYERANRARRTILNRVDQLLAER